MICRHQSRGGILSWQRPVELYVKLPIVTQAGDALWDRRTTHSLGNQRGRLIPPKTLNKPARNISEICDKILVSEAFLRMTMTMTVFDA